MRAVPDFIDNQKYRIHKHAAQSEFDTNVGPKYEFKEAGGLDTDAKTDAARTTAKQEMDQSKPNESRTRETDGSDRNKGTKRTSTEQQAASIKQAWAGKQPSKATQERGESGRAGKRAGGHERHNKPGLEDQRGQQTSQQTKENQTRQPQLKPRHAHAPQSSVPPVPEAQTR